MYFLSTDSTKIRMKTEETLKVNEIIETLEADLERQHGVNSTINHAKQDLSVFEREKT